MSHLVSFTAKKLHPLLLTPFLIDYTQRVLIEGFTLEDSFEAILSSTSHANLSRHSTIVRFFPKTLTVPAIQATEYIFVHERLRPWGHSLPIACPICKCPRAWGRPIKENSTIVFWCKTLNANGVKCPGKARYRKPDGLVPFSRDVGGGRWMMQDLQVI